MNSRESKFYVDDTGADGDGTYTEVDEVVSSEAVARWRSTEEDCRGDDVVKVSKDRREFEISATFKFVKSDAMLQRLLAAYEAGSVCGVQCSTGSTTVGATNAGNMVLTIDSLVEDFTITKQSGSQIEVRAVFKPHAEGSASLPDITEVAAA